MWRHRHTVLVDTRQLSAGDRGSTAHDQSALRRIANRASGEHEVGQLTRNHEW